MGAGNYLRYTPTTCLETFPLPWPPGEEPEGDSRIEAIAEAARRLDELRRNWLNPEGASEAEFRKRTLTNLYNARPTWLENAHARLDAAAFVAYGWPLDIADEEVLQNLPALNLERSEPGQKGVSHLAPMTRGFSTLLARPSKWKPDQEEFLWSIGRNHVIIWSTKFMSS